MPPITSTNRPTARKTRHGIAASFTGGLASWPRGPSVAAPGTASPRSATAGVLGVAQVPRGALRADRGQRPDEVLVGRRRARRPLERLAAPGIVAGHRAEASPEGLGGVPQERQRRRREQERPDGGDLVQTGESVAVEVVGYPAGHALEPEDVL